MSVGQANMATCSGCVLLALFTLITHLSVLYGAVPDQVVQEYCFGEKFDAQCDNGKVIIMTNATYGRMKLGKCIKANTMLGCSTDVLPMMQQLCSGRTECLSSAGSIFTQIHPCGEMFGYLEAAFSCVPVVQARALDCEPGMTSSVPLPSGTLANVITGSSGCGNEDHPWMITADSTQKISLKMTDLTQTANANTNSECEWYGTVKEISTGQEFKLCQGYSELFTSVGNKLQVILRSPALTGEKYFLLHYEVTGCPEPSYPADMWIRRGSSHVTVGCYSSRLSWRLECQNSTWLGQVGNCTIVSKTPVGHFISEIATPAPSTDQKESSSGIAIDSEVGLLLAVAGGVFLSVLLLAVGLLFDKSREKPGRNTPNPSTTPMYGTNTSVRKPAYNTATSNGHSTVPRREKLPSNIPNGNTSNHLARAPQVRDSIADRSSIATGYYDVPHYYELDPDYEDGQNAFVSNGEKNVLIDIQ